VLKICIEEYKALQFNVERETILAYQAKIAQLRFELIDATEARTINSIVSTIKNLNQEINDIQAKIDTDTNATRTSAGDTITFLEQWLLNQRAANARKAQQQQMDEIKRRKLQDSMEETEDKVT
jgi:hypothetical protein